MAYRLGSVCDKDKNSAALNISVYDDPFGSAEGTNQPADYGYTGVLQEGRGRRHAAA